MTFDSNDGGFTKLTLGEPAGLIVTRANAFDIQLKARYYFDPLFRCGFDSAPTSPHDERIQSAFDGERKPTVVTLEQLAAFYRWRVDEEAAEEILAGDYASWVRDVITFADSREFATFFDENISAAKKPAKKPAATKSAAKKPAAKKSAATKSVGRKPKTSRA